MNVSLEASWKEALAPEFEKPYFKQLKNFLVQEKEAGHAIYPPGKLIFNAFDSTPFDRVRAVIIGQDPYHGPGQAHGLCFSVLPGVRIPPSLLNIYKELKDNVGFQIPNHGYLQPWTAQGILMLNAILTVRAGQAASHRNKGWEYFTAAAIKALSDRKEGIVFLLWGKFAQEHAALVDPQRHHILKAAHPSPLAGNAFMGCKHFSRTNELLAARGEAPVEWQV